MMNRGQCRLVTWLFSAWLLAAPWRAAGQLPPDIRLYDAADGLSFRDVRLALRDPRGFLWVVNSGIDFYDGQAFTAFTRFDADHRLPVSAIRTACGLRDSLLLFSESRTLFALNLNTGRVDTFPYPNGMDPGFNDLVAVADRQHHPDLLLFTRSATGTTIHVVDRDWRYRFGYTVSNQEALFPKLQRAYANGPEGVLWLLDQDSLHIRRIEAGHERRIPFAFPVRRPGDTYRFFHDGHSGLYLCRNDGLLFYMRDGASMVEPFLQIPVPMESFYPLHVGPHGRVWGLADNRLLRLDLSDKHVEVYDLKPFGVYNPVFRGSYEDAEGILWISTEMGLLQVNPEPRPFTSVYPGPRIGRNAQFREILPAAAGSVYARVYTEQAELVEIRIHGDQPAEAVVRVPDISRSGLIRRLDDALCYIPSGSEKLILYSLPDFRVREIPLPVRANKQFFNQFVIDRDGTIFYQDIRNQLTGIHPRTGVVKTIPLEQRAPATTSPWRVVQFTGDGKVLLGTETAGLLVFDKSSGKLLGEFNDAGSRPISGNYVNALLLVTDSVVWVGTLGAGINRVNLVTGHVRTYTTVDGLANNMVASLLADEAGNLWIGTFGGLSMYDPAADRFYTYDHRDGLSHDEFNYHSAYADPGGRLYMGTLDGLTVFDPERIIGRRPLPPVRLTRVERYHPERGRIIREGAALDHDAVLRLSPADAYVDLRFAVPSYRAHDSHIFFARLQGIDKTWQRLGRTNSIRYQKLAPGTYTLELMASDANGNTTSAPTLVRIEVPQVFWRSAWFLALVGLVLTAIGYSIYRYRVWLLKKEHRTRTRIASDLHDEVGGSLTGLYLQLQMMELKTQGDERARIGKVARIMDESITKMRDLVWSIDARSDTWAKLLERMADYASDTLSPRDIRFAFHQQIDPALPVDAQWKHNLYLIFKEAVHNIAKHSNAQSVDISFAIRDGRFIMDIRDDGSPTEGAIATPGQGLQNMKIRAERLHGFLTSGHTDRGFAVHLDLPMKR